MDQELGVPQISTQLRLPFGTTRQAPPFCATQHQAAKSQEREADNERKADKGRGQSFARPQGWVKFEQNKKKRYEQYI